MKNQSSVSLCFSLGGDLYDTEEDDHSVALFSACGGIGFVILGIIYLAELDRHIDQVKDEDPDTFGPLLRKEPQTVMVDFIRALAGQERVTWNYSLYPSTMYGPETDIGHYILNTRSQAIEHYFESPWPALTSQIRMLKEFHADPEAQMSPELYRASEYIINGREGDGDE